MGVLRIRLFFFNRFKVCVVGGGGVPLSTWMTKKKQKKMEFLKNLEQ